MDGRDRRLSSLRSGAIGGAPFTPELLREIRRRFEIDVATRYSATEIAMGTGSRPGDPEEMVAETVGRAASEIEIAVVDEAGRRLPAGEVGEVAVCSPPRWSAIGTGPRRRRRCSIARAGSTRATSASSTSAATSACAAGGRRCTSAAVTTCTRRGRSMARSPSPDRAGRGGRSSRSGARREGARGRRAEDRDAPPSAEEIRDYCRSSLADYKAPDFVVIASELPTNTTYKVDKAAIRERFASSRTARDE